MTFVRQHPICDFALQKVLSMLSDSRTRDAVVFEGARRWTNNGEGDSQTRWVEHAWVGEGQFDRMVTLFACPSTLFKNESAKLVRSRFQRCWGHTLTAML